MLNKISGGAWRPPWGGRALLLVVLVAGLFCQGWFGRRKVGAETSDAAFEKGWVYYRLTEFNLAQTYFEASYDLATNDMQRIRALSSQADVWNYRNTGHDRKKAAEIYKRIIEEDTSKAWAPWAALALVRQAQWKAIDQFPDLEDPVDKDGNPVLEDDKPVLGLIKLYRAVMTDYPGTMAAEEAFLYLQTLRIAQLQDDVLATGVEELEEWVVANPDSKLLSRAYAMLGHGYHLQRQGVKYIGALAKSSEIALIQGQNENIPQADQSENYFKMGVAAQFDAGDFEMARKYYRMLIEEAPTDQRVFIAEQHMAQMDEYEESVREELKRLATNANGEEQ